MEMPRSRPLEEGRIGGEDGSKVVVQQGGPTTNDVVTPASRFQGLATRACAEAWNSGGAEGIRTDGRGADVPVVDGGRKRPDAVAGDLGEREDLACGEGDRTEEKKATARFPLLERQY